MKQQFFHRLPLLITLALAVSCATSSPGWYVRGAPEPGFLIDMGKGETANEAKTRALSDIAEQLEVRISAETRIEVRGTESESRMLLNEENSRGKDRRLQD